MRPKKWVWQSMHMGLLECELEGIEHISTAIVNPPCMGSDALARWKHQATYEPRLD